MEQPLVSVVVPVYNVEKYLDQCLSSIAGQTYEALEIITVDDGSTDNSRKKCDGWAAEDVRFKVVHQENAGLGLARNAGLSQATGTYVIFVDSDDFLHADAITILIRAAQRSGADTVFCGWNRYHEDGRVTQCPLRYKKNLMTGGEIVEDILLDMIGTLPDATEDSGFGMSVWHALYSLEIINSHGILFPSEREFVSEDIIFHIDYLQHSQKAAVIPDCLYYYRKNSTSLSLAYNPERFKKEVALFGEINRRLALILPESAYQPRAQRMFLRRARSCVMRAACDPKAGRDIRNICGDSVLQGVLHSYPIHQNPPRHRVFNFCLRHRLKSAVRLMAWSMKKNLAR